MYVFFSSRRRHTMCALVTGVQTWALPISANGSASSRPLPRASMFEGRRAPEMERAQELYLATIPETGLGRRGRISLSIAPLRDTARQHALYRRGRRRSAAVRRSEEHTSELQSLMRSSYADSCLTKKNQNNIIT